MTLYLDLNSFKSLFLHFKDHLTNGAQLLLLYGISFQRLLTSYG